MSRAFSRERTSKGSVESIINVRSKAYNQELSRFKVEASKEKEINRDYSKKIVQRSIMV
jgi:hypothetical protein